jgi:hypothetical protein
VLSDGILSVNGHQICNSSCDLNMFPGNYFLDELLEKMRVSPYENVPRNSHRGNKITLR